MRDTKTLTGRRKVFYVDDDNEFDVDVENRTLRIVAFVTKELSADIQCRSK